jgi:hypothetical protein
MATARELLEQADALMRRNRARGEAPPGGPVAAPIVAPEATAAELDDFPVLTDVVAGVDPISELDRSRQAVVASPVEPLREAFILAEEPSRRRRRREPPPLIDLAEDAAVIRSTAAPRRKRSAMQVLQRLDIHRHRLQSSSRHGCIDRRPREQRSRRRDQPAPGRVARLRRRGDRARDQPPRRPGSALHVGRRARRCLHRRTDG